MSLISASILFICQSFIFVTQFSSFAVSSCCALPQNQEQLRASRNTDCKPVWEREMINFTFWSCLFFVLCRWSSFSDCAEQSSITRKLWCIPTAYRGISSSLSWSFSSGAGRLCWQQHLSCPSWHTHKRKHPSRNFDRQPSQPLFPQHHCIKEWNAQHRSESFSNCLHRQTLSRGLNFRRNLHFVFQTLLLCSRLGSCLSFFGCRYSFINQFVL